PGSAVLAGCSKSAERATQPRRPAQVRVAPAPGATKDQARVPPHVAAPGVSPPTGPTLTAPSSIAANCSTDVSAALQSWIDSVPDNATIAFPQNGCYRIESTLRLKDRHDLLLDGHGATLRATTPGAGARL